VPTEVGAEDEICAGVVGLTDRKIDHGEFGEGVSFVFDGTVGTERVEDFGVVGACEGLEVALLSHSPALIFHEFWINAAGYVDYMGGE
jgi:hypothetical protein